VRDHQLVEPAALTSIETASAIVGEPSGSPPQHRPPLAQRLWAQVTPESRTGVAAPYFSAIAATSGST